MGVARGGGGGGGGGGGEGLTLLCRLYSYARRLCCTGFESFGYGIGYR